MIIKVIKIVAVCSMLFSALNGALGLLEIDYPIWQSYLNLALSPFIIYGMYLTITWIPPLRIKHR